jgi:hypothetical protein
MVAVVVSTTYYLYFTLYPTTLTAFSMVSLNWWRLGSSVLSCIGGCIFLGTGSISYIVGC